MVTAAQRFHSQRKKGKEPWRMREGVWERDRERGREGERERERERESLRETEKETQWESLSCKIHGEFWSHIRHQPREVLLDGHGHGHSIFILATCVTGRAVVALKRKTSHVVGSWPWPLIIFSWSSFSFFDSICFYTCVHVHLHSRVSQRSLLERRTPNSIISSPLRDKNELDVVTSNSFLLDVTKASSWLFFAFHSLVNDSVYPHDAIGQHSVGIRTCVCEWQSVYKIMSKECTNFSILTKHDTNRPYLRLFCSILSWPAC